MKTQTSSKPKRNWLKFCFIWFFLTPVALGAVIYLSQDDSVIQTTVPKTEKLPPTEAKLTHPPVSYEIIDSEDLSKKAIGSKRLSDFSTQEIAQLPTNKKWSYSVTINNDVKQVQVQPTMDQIIKDLTVKDPDLDEIILFVYSDKEAKKNQVYDIGKATWAPYGKLGNMTPIIAQKNDRSQYQITYDIKANIEEYLKKRNSNENKFGLTENQRRELFKKVSQAEMKASEEAEAKHPITNWEDMNQLRINSEYRDQLETSYKQALFQEYGITKEQFSEILTEAFAENWDIGL